MRKRHCRHNFAGHYLDPSASCVKALDVLSRRAILQVDDRIQRFPINHETSAAGDASAQFLVLLDYANSFYAR